MADSSGYKFPILNSDGTYSTTIVDMADMFVRKELFLDAGLWGFGYNLNGQLGDGTVTSSKTTPVISGLNTNNWKQQSCGDHTAAVKTDGSLWTWGLNTSGQLGKGNTVSSAVPTQVGTFKNWKQVACGQNFTASVKTDGTLWTWGINTYGQLGTSTVAINYLSPVQVGALTNWKQVACGQNFFAAVKTDGTLWTCGYNTTGCLGNGNNTHYSSPIQVGALTNWKQVSCGTYHWFGIKINGDLWACGYDVNGVLGNNATIAFPGGYSSPIQIGSLTNWKQIASGKVHTISVKTDGTLWSWGQGSSGQLGNGTASNYSSPIQVGSLTTWKQVSCGTNFSVATKTDGTLWSWGFNDNGQLGTGIVSINYSSPVQVGSLTFWKQVACGNSHTEIVASPSLP